MERADVEVVLKNGRRIASSVETVKGSSDRPLTNDELEQKLLVSSSGSLSPELAQMIRWAVFSLDKEANLDALLALTSGPISAV
jgi:hypothetical protein